MTTPVEHQDNSGLQVFQPVPTQSDFAELSDRVQQARRGQARLLITSIFLAGVIAAGLAAAALAYGHLNTQVAALETTVAEQVKALEAKDGLIAEANAKIESQKQALDSYADYQSIAALQSQADQLEQEIAALLAEPVRANAPARLRKLPEDVEWLDTTVAALRARRDALQALKSEIQAWPPVPQSPRPD
ncbi:MAG: hypothetical protein R3C13_10685 [Hyphomonas sp.]|uniref:hypothetical protein n=1 Tax=Hyphomonas sp. TaxID=87 RepID=UPI0035276F97